MTSDRRTGKIPPADYYESMPEGATVYSWCPTPEPTVPPTQVHLHIPVGGAVIVMRFKGPGTLDAFIDALVKHREDVFGPRKTSQP